MRAIGMQCVVQSRPSSQRDGSNRNELQLHLHAGRVFSRIVQMDPAIGPVADETLENQKHVRETEGKCGG
jgi:hypothetical protein